MKQLFVMLAVTCAAVAGRAEQNWAALYSVAYQGDASPSLENRSQYTAYYCSVAAAEDQKIFGGATSMTGIETFLKDNFVVGKSALAEHGTELSGGDYGLNRYSFIQYGISELDENARYLAVAFYGETAFRVFDAANSVIDSGRLLFTDKNAPAGTVGEWQMSVPEPTSGLLLLTGLAGLCLRRKRR